MKKLLILIFISMLFGCAETPDEVKEEIDKYNNTINNSNCDFEFEYIPVSELSDNFELSLKHKYSQFSISNSISFDQPNEINIMSFKKREEFNEFQKIMKLFFTSHEISNQVINESEEYTSFYNEIDKIYGCVGKDGFISILKPNAFDISFSYNEPNIKAYHINQSENLNDEYQFVNGTYSISEAVSYVNNWLENEYSVYSSDFKYNVKSIIVREHKGNYLFEILANASYKGVPIDSYTREAEFINGQPTGEMTYVDYGIQIQMIEKNSIDSFTNLIGIIEPLETQKVDKVISLESALKYCENTFTDFKDMIISDINVMYTLNPIYYNYDNNDISEKRIKSYNSRPVWELVIDVPSEEYIADGEINTYGDIRKYIYIDMLDGECKYNFDIIKQGFGR